MFRPVPKSVKIFVEKKTILFIRNSILFGTVNVMVLEKTITNEVFFPFGKFLLRLKSIVSMKTVYKGG